MPNENSFQAKFIKDLQTLLPDAIIVKNDPNYIQGMPDLLILYKDRWAAVEVKKSRNAKKRPNQEYYVDLLNSMSYSSFVYPENRETVLDELQQALRPRRSTCISRRKQISLD